MKLSRARPGWFLVPFLLSTSCAFAAEPVAAATILPTSIGGVQLGWDLGRLKQSGLSSSLTLVPREVLGHRGWRRGRWNIGLANGEQVGFDCFCRVDQGGQWRSAGVTGAPGSIDATVIRKLSTEDPRPKTTVGVGVGDAMVRWMHAYPQATAVAIQGVMTIDGVQVKREVVCFQPRSSAVQPPVAVAPFAFVLSVEMPAAPGGLVGRYAPDADRTFEVSPDARVLRVTIGADCEYATYPTEYWE